MADQEVSWLADLLRERAETRVEQSKPWGLPGISMLSCVGEPLVQEVSESEMQSLNVYSRVCFG
jgi:hypothetical protein